MHATSRLLAHMAPGILAWIYIAWIAWACSSEWSGRGIFRGLVPIQLAVCALAAIGGVCAFRLPSRRQRLGVAVGSLSGAIVLLEAIAEIFFF